MKLYNFIYPEKRERKTVGGDAEKKKSFISLMLVEIINAAFFYEQNQREQFLSANTGKVDVIMNLQKLFDDNNVNINMFNLQNAERNSFKENCIGKHAKIVFTKDFCLRVCKLLLIDEDGTKNMLDLCKLLVICEKDKISIEEAKDFVNTIEEVCRKLLITFEMNPFCYIHVLARHMKEQLVLHGSVGKFCAQSVEMINNVLKGIYFGHTNKNFGSDEEGNNGSSHYLDQMTSYFVGKCRAERKYRIVKDSDIEKSIVKDPFVGLRSKGYLNARRDDLDSLIDAEIVRLGKRKRDDWQDSSLRKEIKCGNSPKRRKLDVEILSDSQNDFIF